jgi:flagellar assembly protein FliH
MIKAYAVRYDDVSKKTIDIHFKTEKEIDVRRSRVIQAIDTNHEFVEGLQAFVVDALPPVEHISEQSSQILEDARNEAQNILEQAKKEAERLKNDTYTAAHKKGYDEGILQGKRELQKRKTEFDEKEVQLQEEYEKLATSIEPQMVEIIASLVEKITGIVIKDKQDVIFYLVEKALKNMDKTDEYTIRVSKEDYEFINGRKNLLLAAIGREVPLYIIEDSNLIKNKCFIETELRVIDCSLDIQLNNLLMDLKLIGSI